jgi:mannitol-1-phosphate/altronate dehydrogenase
MWLEVGEALPIEGYFDYTQNLRRRFANPHMDHHLAKIAINGPAKLRSRCLPVMVLRAKEKRLASPVLAMQLAGWLLYLERADPATLDPESIEFQNQLSRAGEEGLGDLIFRLDETAANIDLVVESVREAYDQAKKGQIN